MPSSTNSVHVAPDSLGARELDLVAPQSPQHLAEFLATLPPWNPSLDDDPAWVRPTVAYGFTVIGEDEAADLAAIRAARAAASALVAGATPVPVDPSRAVFTCQDHVRLDVLGHYVNGDRTQNWDRDGWFGNDHPVLTPWHGGYLVLDGTHRIVADRIAGRPATLAHVVPNIRYASAD